MKTYPISIQLWTLRSPMESDPRGTLEAVSKIGYAQVEPAGLYGFTPTELRKLVEDLGMKIGSSHMPWANRTPTAEAIEVAKELGLNKIACGYGPEDFASLESIKRTADEVNRLVETVAKANLKLFMHNHAWEYKMLEGRLAIDHFLDICPDVLFELDLYWAANFGANDTPALVRRFADRIPLLHVKDAPLLEDEPNVALGEGEMDLPACIQEANTDRLEALVFEMDHCATDLLEAAKKSFEYLVNSGLGHGQK